MVTQEIINEALRRFPSEAERALNEAAARSVLLLCERHLARDHNEVREVLREAKAVFKPIIARTVLTLAAEQEGDTFSRPV